jgi:hypothetical protein
VDAAGNATTASTTGRAWLVPETAAQRTGGWTRTLHDSHDGGEALIATAPGSSLTWTFTGRGVALVGTRTKWSGQLKVYVDGTYVGIADLQGSFTAYRQAVWVRGGLTPGGHTLTVVVVGTPDRPATIVDGMVGLS